MGRKNRLRDQRKEEKLEKKRKREEENNKTKTEQDRKKEADRLLEQLKNLGLATSAGMDPFLVKMKHYVDTGETWTGTAFLQEHKKYLHVNLTNKQNQYCGIRISDDP